MSSAIVVMATRAAARNAPPFMKTFARRWRSPPAMPYSEATAKAIRM